MRAEGSSYRQPGARLLLGSAGSYAGTISGGCLETEVTRKAAWLTRNGPTVERYSTLFDDTAEIPFGLGCGGLVDLLYERADTPEAQALFHALEDSLKGTPSTVFTWLPEPGSPLRRAILDQAGNLLFASANILATDVPPICSTPVTGVYEEHLNPPQRLLLLGAGDDARPVASMAALLGWTVLIADGRAHLARPARFPEACAVQPLASAAGLQSFDLAPADAVVLMTHSYEQDRDMLASLLSVASPPGYIGVLGARHRTSLLITEAARLTGRSIEEVCRCIHAPVGLDLGGDGPEAIALAVVAEIQTFSQGRQPASRRRLNEAEVVHHLAQGGPTRYRQTHCALDQAS